MKGKIDRWPEKGSLGFVVTEGGHYYRIISKGINKHFPKGMKRGEMVDFRARPYGNSEADLRKKAVGTKGDAELIPPPKPRQSPQISRGTRQKDETRRQHAKRYFGALWSTLMGNINEKDFFIAISMGSFGTVATFLQQGINPNQVDRNDFLPLCLALKSKQWEIAELLMIYGADPHTQNTHGLSAIYVVQERGGFDGWHQAQIVLSNIHSSSYISSPQLNLIQPETLTLDDMSTQKTLPTLTSSSNYPSQNSVEVEQFQQELRDPLDGSRGIGFYARDFDGKIGSHSGYDNYGDESSP